MSKFFLGTKSRDNLKGVDPRLVAVVERAIQITPVDFQVFEGLRTPERQRKLYASGASMTLNSKHLTQPPTGFGHAVDLVPMIDFNGDGRAELRWDWTLCYEVAAAVRTAAAELKTSIRWGGVWDRTIGELGGDLEECVATYVQRRKRQGLRAFTDGPHYEIA